MRLMCSYSPHSSRPVTQEKSAAQTSSLILVAPPLPEVEGAGASARALGSLREPVQLRAAGGCRHPPAAESSGSVSVDDHGELDEHAQNGQALDLDQVDLSDPGALRRDRDGRIAVELPERDQR